jgi:type I restriction enzyme S subunit
MAKYRFEQIAINSTEKKKPTEEDRFTYLGLEHLDSGSLKVTRWGSDVAPIGEKLIMHQGDVLFGKRRAYQKKVVIAPFDGIFSAHGMVLRPREDVVDKRFFPLFISSDYFLDAAIKISVGSLSPTINWRDLKNLEFEIPDLDTQRKLADVLWSINDTMEAYKKLIAATDELVKSQFIEMFGIPETDPFGWGLTTLGECCELNPHRPKNMRTDAVYSFVAIPSVSEDGRIDTSIGRPYEEVNKGFTYFAENDVLFAKITPCMENGKGGVAIGLQNGAGFGSTEFHVLRPKKGISDPYWLYIITMFPQFRFDAEKVMTGTGGQRRVPITYLSGYPVTLPPIELQEQFAAFVRQSDKSKFELEQALAELTATYKRIMAENLG